MDYHIAGIFAYERDMKKECGECMIRRLDREGTAGCGGAVESCAKTPCSRAGSPPAFAESGAKGW